MKAFLNKHILLVLIVYLIVFFSLVLIGLFLSLPLDNETLELTLKLFVS